MKEETHRILIKNLKKYAKESKDTIVKKIVRQSELLLCMLAITFGSKMETGWQQWEQIEFLPDFTYDPAEGIAANVYFDATLNEYDISFSVTHMGHYFIFDYTIYERESGEAVYDPMGDEFIQSLVQDFYLSTQTYYRKQ